MDGCSINEKKLVPRIGLLVVGNLLLDLSTLLIPFFTTQTFGI